MESLEIKKRHNVLELDRLERTGNIDIGIYLHDSMLEGLITINKDEARELIAWLIEATGEELVSGQAFYDVDIAYREFGEFYANSQSGQQAKRRDARKALLDEVQATLNNLRNPANK